jgi:hypothetical protein
MIRASAHGLSTPRAADWRESAACRTEDPELFFPPGDSGPWLLTIEQAKAICAACPVLAACGQWAADNHNQVKQGIFGGLTERERASLHRSAVRRRLSPKEAARKAQEKRQPEQPRTLQSIYDEGTTRLHGGHLAWTGPKRIDYRGQTFTPKQLSYLLDRGRMPDGQMRSECGISECVLPSHIADAVERTRCGTRPGYRRHLERGETPCGPCRRENADADNRLRWTGTTRVAA